MSIVPVSCGFNVFLVFCTDLLDYFLLFLVFIMIGSKLVKNKQFSVLDDNESMSLKTDKPKGDALQ